MEGDETAAEKYYRDVLKRDVVVLGSEHPDLAITLNNLGRLLVERRAFTEALPLLERSLRINLRERGDTQDDLAFVFANLAIARRGVGEVAQAEADLSKGLAAARQHGHRNVGPILTDLADLRCATGRVADALPLLEEAEPLMKRDYPDDPWRAAWAENVRGACMVRSGEEAAAAPLLSRSKRLILARWAPQSYYGWAASNR
jgi:tetratricopeptide (TPR) repeat protein